MPPYLPSEPLAMLERALAAPLFVRDANNGITDAMLHSGNLTQVAWYYTAHPVPQVFNPGIIVASIAVAVLGSYSTLLLLGKRTSNKGARNFTLLVLAATTMSSVGIWGMHFIGMHMQLNPVKDVVWYIQFNPGFTVFSLFVPTISLVLAFFFVDDQLSFSVWRICVSGVTTGLIVSLMHYSASFKANFIVTYDPLRTVFSIILACIASTLALFSFFRLRAQWEDSWWKRLVCALILGAGVAGMHYLGAAGTSYYVPADASIVPEILASGAYQSNVVTIAIGAMCFAIIVASIFIAVSDVLTARHARSKAKKVVVCSATFDKQGRLLVKHDGTMPLMVIETEIAIKDMLEALDNRQSTFQWLYAISWDWDIVAPFLRAITDFFIAKGEADQQNEAAEKGRGRLFQNKAGKVLRHGRGSLDVLGQASTSGKGPAALAEFRDRFIDAAHQLSSELDIPFQQIGVLYDRVFPTGTRKAALQAASNGDVIVPTRRREDDESSINSHVPSIFGDGENEEEGLMLFLVRELPKTNTGTGESVEKYRQRGYRMTETRFLAGVLADRVAVTKPEMESMLDSLRLYAKRGTRPVVQPGGVYAGLFGVRPSTSRQGGLDVLVYNFARHQIPAYRLPDVTYVTQEMRAFLRMLHQMSMEEAMKTCERESIRSGERRRYGDNNAFSHDMHKDGFDDSNIEQMIQFQTALFIALDALHNSVRFYPRIAQTARISAEVLEVPSSLDDTSPPAQMILVQAVLPEARANASTYSDMIQSTAAKEAIPTDKPGNGTPFVFTPYSLFSKSQMMLMRGRQADDFEHEVVIELRRRYPSSLLQEAEGSPMPMKGQAPSLMSNDMSFNNMDHKLHDDDEDDAMSAHSTKAHSTFANARRWLHKTSQDGIKSVKGESFPLSPRRSSFTLGLAKPQTPQNDKDEMRQIMKNMPSLNSSNTLGSSPISPSSTATAVNTPDRLPAYSQTNGVQSYGIRRFTEGGAPASAFNTAGRFVQPADEAIAEESPTKTHLDLEPSSDDDRSVHSRHTGEGLAAPAPIYEPRPRSTASTRKRPATAAPGTEPEPQGALVAPLPRAVTRTNSQNVMRPSTAPSGGRREAALMRPRTADSANSTRILSQRHAATHVANPSQSNEASMLARLRSDDWATRQLQSLERGPSASLLLGVDF